MKYLKRYCGSIVLVLLIVSIGNMQPVYSEVSTKQKNVVSFLSDVAGLDMAKYAITVVRENVTFLYRFTTDSNSSLVEALCDFRNDELVWCKLYAMSGSPLFTQSATTDSIMAAKNLISRYQSYSKAPFTTQMQETLNLVSELKVESAYNDYRTMKEAATASTGNVTLTVWIEDEDYSNLKFEWMNSINGIKNIYNRVTFDIKNGAFRGFADNWDLYPIGCDEIKITRERAVESACESLKTFSYSVGDKVIGNLAVAKDFPVSAEVSMQPRKGLLYPHWEIYLPLDKMYLGQVTSVRVMMWADTGEIDSIQPTSTLGDPSNGASPTPSAAPTSEPSAQATDNLSGFDARLIATACAVVVIAAIAGSALVAKRRLHQHKSKG